MSCPDRPRSDRNEGSLLTSLLQENVLRVRSRIAAAATAAGREPDDVRLISVTKSVTPEVAMALAAVGDGKHELGENRLPSFEAKVEAFRAAGVDARWHFIGHLQRNKARRVARLADEIHAVDTAALCDTLARIAEEEGVSPALYLQVKLTDDATKHGLAPEEVPPLVERAAARGQRLAGLMTMGPLAGGAEAARPVFDRLAELAATLPAKAFVDGRVRLSMGMSGDLEEAIGAGADDVRIGTALFEGLPEGWAA